MNTEFGALPESSDPFAALLNPGGFIAAHERLASRTPGVVYRPLEYKGPAPRSAAGEAEPSDYMDFGDDTLSGPGTFN